MIIKDSVALVTGGNRGIGEAFVRALVEAGACKVYVGARSPGDAQHLSDEFPGRAVIVRLDVTDPEQIAGAARGCGDVSILVNNAGQFAMRRLIDAPDMSGARSEMEANYFGPLMMCRAFAPVLARSPESAIINVLSAAAIVAVPGMGGYSPSKFAGRAMSTCIRAELAPQKTHVAALIVGSIDTRMAGHVKGYKEPPSVVAAAGLRAIERRIDEVDTDAMAVEVRANLALDPKGQELQMRKSLSGERVTTDRGASA
ncbi:SDR family oxidoreductase [Phenylobacterium montanum]|uniref:SDR family oxidoreductase n=1 Tax=Phenylobacterium montanum TaxID=2823693 RepID=A0A975G2S8_9CAUL|nr:SDR family oxidoreductase [Caulobacter sp. S6]QUD89498.1 SDR family oxidoreductase [Caulobacter sp. S6]